MNSIANERINTLLSNSEILNSNCTSSIFPSIRNFVDFIKSDVEILSYITKDDNVLFNIGKEVESVLSSYGTKSFNLGNNVSEVVCNTYKLLNYITDNKIPIEYLGASYTKSNNFDDRIEAFVKQIIYPFIEYIKIFLERQEKLNLDQIKKIFIVHGHDNTAKLEMARTLERSGFEAIILHEQASAGKTIIEKIEANTDVAFAVVLYTPCDMGRAKEATVDVERSRARQNVIFEHGYLIGKLGREHVCALVKDKIETPGDISGVVYIPMDDAGAWKMALAKEMINAGLQVDMNKFCS